ncbi:MAG: hypothetical protein OEV94_11850 [Deltaproteobacteria bacterium]|nr:hypothetical protein [Deltaproteobacteria bacterium]
MILLPYQSRWLKDLSPVKAAEKGRRVGLSWAEAGDAALIAAASETAGGQDYWYIGYNQDMAQEFVRDCADWAKAYQLAAADVEETVLEDEDKSILAYRIKMASGFRVTALSSRPTNLRGKQGVICIDEAAFHEHLGELLKAAIALLMWGGKVRIISTHNGDGNPFNQLVRDILAGVRPYSHHKITLDDALRDGLYQRICQKLERAWTREAEAAWRKELTDFYGSDADEELFCIPSQGSGRWLSRALVEARMRPGPVLRLECPPGYDLAPEPQRQAETADWLTAQVDPLLKNMDGALPSHFGMDIGREHDLSAIAPCQVSRLLVRRFPFVIEMRRVPFAQQKQVLRHLVERLPRFSGGAIDSTGIGADIAESTAQRFGGGMIHRVKLSEPWYRDQMAPLKQAFEDGSIELPAHADLLNDLLAFRVVKGISKPPERDGQNGADGQPRHADSGIAIALAHFASRQGAVEYGWTSAYGEKKQHGPDQDDRPGRWANIAGHGTKGGW